MKIYVLLVAVLLSGCSTTTTIPTFKAHITLPASGDGYWVNSVATGIKAQDEGRIPKEQWTEKRKRAVDLLSDDWAILRRFLLENCLMNQCKLIVGKFDDLFIAIDNALKKMPNP